MGSISLSVPEVQVSLVCKAFSNWAYKSMEKAKRISLESNISNTTGTGILQLDTHIFL
jgi:hypothetical protein